MKRILSAVICFFMIAQLAAQRISPQEYIELYKDLAIREMKRMGVPAAITLAQGILETESGNSVLVKKSNNHFGIKCKNTWTSNGVSHDDDAKGECFRQYTTAEDSYRDHSNFLRAGERYAFLFGLSANDYKGWAHGLKKAGYATNPAYPAILIKNIEQYNLNQYTLAALTDVPKYDRAKYQDDPEEKKESSAIRTVQSMNEPQIKGGSAASQTYPTGVFKFEGKKVVFAKKGTSLLRIADEQEIRLVKLLEYNDMKEDGLLKEDKLVYLEQKPDNPPIIVADAPVSNSKKHIVQPKEGLYAISKKYGASVQQLKDWNSLSSDELKVGQELVVSQ